MRKERNPPQEQPEISVKISGNLAAHISEGARKSGLTPTQYVLSLLWHNVPLKQKAPDGLPPECVQLVLNDIYHHYVDLPFTGVLNPYEAAGMTHEDFCGSANGDEAGETIQVDELPF